MVLAGWAPSQPCFGELQVTPLAGLRFEPALRSLQCPLWVISGHPRGRLKTSAFGGKADIANLNICAAFRAHGNLAPMDADHRKRDDRLFTLKDVIAVLPASFIGCGR